MKTTKQTVTNTSRKHNLFSPILTRKDRFSRTLNTVNYSLFLYRSSLQLDSLMSSSFHLAAWNIAILSNWSIHFAPKTRIMTTPCTRGARQRWPKINILCVFKPPGMSFSDHKFLPKAAKGYKFYTLSIFITGEMKRISVS